jgi:hypothetical protein
MNVAAIKADVRRRDGHCCTQCGMTNAEHRLRYRGRSLDVHRVIPGSLYTVEGCVTLCRRCHGPQPRRRRGQPDLGRPGDSPINFRAPDDLAALLEDVAEGLGLDISNLVRMVLYENLAPYEERAAQAKANRGHK